MENVTYREALRRALDEELERDPNVFLMGEEIGRFDGSYKVTQGLWKKYGPKRVRETPIAEEGFVGAGVGAAMLGQRPVVEIMTINFILVAMDMVVNHAAKVRSMFGGKLGVPMVIRTPAGAGAQLTAQHSQSFEVMFAHVPGLKVVAPSTPLDAYGMLKSAIRDDDPVIFVENLVLYNTTGELPPPGEDFTVPLGVAKVVREGRDLTLVAHSYTVNRALTVADRLATEGIEVEVVDLRSLRPLDAETVCASVTQDEPRADRRGGLVDLRGRRRARRAHPARLLRRPGRAGRARRRRRGADAVREAARARRARRRGQDRGGSARAARRVRTSGRGTLMAVEIPMPRLSDTMERGTVARWAKKEGDTVAEGEVLADIETDKATMELESYETGVLLKILVQEGESAELGAPIALVGEAGEQVELPSANGDGAAAEQNGAEPAPAAAAAPVARAARPAAAPAGAGELRASPIARRMAADAGLDLRPLAGRGSGPDGRIVKVDVERLAADGVSCARRRRAADHAAQRAAARRPFPPRGRARRARSRPPCSAPSRGA